MATRRVIVGSVPLGHGAPIAVQSMCTTKTSDVGATVSQINSLAAAGCDVVRVGIPDNAAAKAIAEIKKSVAIPVVADIHFDYRLAIASLEAGADKIRINPGNIGNREKVAAVINAAKKKDAAIRIGVNSGSLPRDILKKYHNKATAEGMVEAAEQSIAFFEREKFTNIVLSLKHSDVKTVITAYRLMAERTDYPLHLGVTEAGTFVSGTVKSAIAIGSLLADGIGDTIRVSLTDDPVKEIEIGWKILESLHLRRRGPEIISCPTCARTSVSVMKLAREIEEKTNFITSPIKIAVMGCLVNGPGEAREADVGVCGIDAEPGFMMLFKKGEIVEKIREEDVLAAILKEIDEQGKNS